MDRYDVVIVGAGLAGLCCARLLGEQGWRVLLADRKRSLGTSVHTTGIFVRKTLEDFDLPADCLGPAVRRVTLYSPARRALTLESPHDEFRVGRMARLYERWCGECRQRGAAWSPDSRYRGTETDGENTTVWFETQGRPWSVETRFLIGADGAVSRVARDLRLGRNREWIVGVEDVLEGVPLDGPPCFHCFLDPRLAPGYLAWVVHDGEAVHLGVGGYADRFHPLRALTAFRESVAERFGLAAGRTVERRGGRIPVGGILARIAGPRGLLVGDAAGAVSPLTAGGLDPCLRLSHLAARVTADFLLSGDPAALAPYSGDRFRSRFVSRRWMRRLLSGLRHPAPLEAACALLRPPPLRGLAAHVFFGRGSFPNIDLAPVRQPQTLPGAR